MRKYIGEITKHTAWDGDASTGDLPVAGMSIEDHIKNTFETKFGCLYQDGGKVLVFADAENRDLYLEDRTAHADLLLGSFDAPAEFKMRIEMLTETYATVLKGSTAAPIRFTFRTENSQGQPQGESATVTFAINASGTKTSITQRNNPGDEIIFDPTPYLGNPGNVVITITATGTATLASTSVSVAYKVVDLLLEDRRNPQNIGQVWNRYDTMTIDYEVAGYGTKTVEWYVDGEQLEAEPGDIAQTPSEQHTKRIDLSSLEPGTHVLQYRAYIVDGGVPFYSQTLYRTFFVAGADGVGVAAELSPGTLVEGSLTIDGLEQYVPCVLRVAGYDTGRNNASLTVTVKDGDTVELTATLTAQRGSEHQYSFTPMTYGRKTIELTCGEAVMAMRADIAPTSTGLAETTEGRTLDLTAQGKSNASADRDQWGDGLAQFDGFNWDASSGWTTEGLKFAPESSATIGATPLLANATTTGRAIEMEVNMLDVTDDDAVIMDMTDEGVGATLTASSLKLRSRQGKEVEVRFAADRPYRFGIVIERPTSRGGLAMLYVNGIMSAAVDFAQSDDFGTAMMTWHGAEGATPLLRSVRAYDVALSKDQMVDSYILSRPTATEMLAAFQRNNIRDDHDPSRLDPDKVASKVPVCLVTGNIGELQGANRNKNLRVKVDIEFRDDSQPWRGFTIKNASLRPQGTSSMEFWIKNFRPDAKYNPDCQMFDYQGNEVDPRLWAMWTDSIPVNLWCWKADYMESSGTHNTGIARLWNAALKNAKFSGADMQAYGEYPLRTMAQQAAIDAGYDKDVRTCIDGFPCVLFTRLTENDRWNFAGKYNFNNDKSTEAVFGFKDIPGFDNSHMECWEVLDSANQLALFQSTEGWDDNWDTAFEGRYPDGGTDTTNLKAFADWLVSVKDDPEAFTVEKYAHLDVPKTAAYYVYLMMHGAVDQTVKNAMFTTEDGAHWFYILYDNDTTHGLINTGYLILGPYITRQSLEPGRSTYAYAGHESVLWNMLEADPDFMAMVTKVAAALQSSGISLANSLDMFNVQQSGKWCERVYNADADLKYIQVQRNGSDNRLYALQGSRESHRAWWLTRRFAFLDSLLLTPAFKGNSVSFRLDNYTDADLVIKAGAPVYLAWSTDNGNTYRQSGVYADAESEAVTFATEGNVAYNSPVFLYGAPDFEELDLSDAIEGMRTLSLAGCYSESRGTKLKRLVLGASGRTNTVSEFQGFDFSLFKALEYVDIRGYANVNTADISVLPKLSTFLASGTSLGEFVPAEGSRLSTVALPATVSTVTLRSLANLSNAGLTHEAWSNVRKLTIESCPNIDTLALVTTWMNANGNLGKSSLRLTDVAWTTTVDTMVAMASVGTMDVSGDVTLTGTLDGTKINQLIGLYGADCFSPGAKLRFKAQGQMQIVAPASVLEGKSEAEADVVSVLIFAEEYDNLSISVTNANPDTVHAVVNLGARTVALWSDETGVARSVTVIVSLRVPDPNDAMGNWKTVSANKTVSIAARTYPTDFTIDGDRYADHEATRISVEPTGTGNGVWRAEYSYDYEGEHPNGLQLSNADQTGVTVSCLSVSGEEVADIYPATLTVNFYKNGRTEPYKTKTMPLCVHDGTIAIHSCANAPVMTICHNQGWSANADYMTKHECAAVTSIAEYTFGMAEHFREFRFFSSLKSVPNFIFRRPNGSGASPNNGLFIIPEGVTSVGTQLFGVHGVYNRGIRPKLGVDFPSTLKSCGVSTLGLHGSQGYPSQVTKVWMRPTTPPTVTDNKFICIGDISNNPIPPRVMYVPSGSEQAYLNAQWVKNMVNNGWVVSATL